MTTQIRSAEERRAEIEAHAKNMGVDDAYISLLVETFYDRVWAHPILGPVFKKAIPDDARDAHLAKMKDFWASVALNAGRYSGRPVPKHVALDGVEPWHFGVWLGLFEQTLRDTVPTSDAEPYFMERAERIAQSLKFAMFGLPQLNAHAQRPIATTPERNAPSPSSPALPEGAVKYTQTPEFTEETVPEKLLADHSTKPGVWGKLRVLDGALDYVVPGPPSKEKRVTKDEHVIIEPEILHYVRPTQSVRFLVEFHRLAE